MELLWYTKRCERRMTHANLDKSGGLGRRTGGCGHAGLHCRGEGWAMKSVRPLAVPPVAYIENATADAVVDVIYPAMTYRKGYTEFKADNLPRQGRVEYISPRGWATLMLLSNADTRPLYRESFWILKR